VFRALLIAFGCASACACADTAYSEPPARNLLSESGSLRLELRTPSGVARGTNEVLLHVSRGDSGAPTDELVLEMLPFMPAMGHGSGVSPLVTPLGSGDYAFSEVVLNMAGRWQLRTAISGERSDHVVFDVDVP